MDADGQVSRLERTFWTVWYYITGAVNRFIRPEPETANNDANSSHDSSVDSERRYTAHTDVDIIKEGDEEQPLATASLLSPSHPVVSWDVCTTDIDLAAEKDNMQYETQLSRGSEGTSEEQFAQTGNDGADLLMTKGAEEDEQENDGDVKLYGHDGDVMAKTDEEQLNSNSLKLTDIAMNEDMEKTGQSTDDQQRIDQVKENFISCRLRVEETEVKLSTITDLHPIEQGDMHIEEAELQRDDEDTAWAGEEVENSDVVLHLASGLEPGPKQAENQFSVCKQLPDDDRDFKGDSSMTLSDTEPRVELQTTNNKHGIVSDDGLTVVKREQTIAEASERSANGKDEEDHNEEEGDSTVDEREQSADSIEEENVKEEQEEDNERVTENSKEEDIITEQMTCSEGFTLNLEDGDQEDMTTHGIMISEKTDVVTKAISVNEGLFDINNDREEEERLSSEEDDRESQMERPCPSTSVTVKHEGETGQEKCKANTLLGTCEGHGVVSLELNSTTYKETQEGVPEYNNEPEPDGNTTQRFLEAGDYKEFQTTQLPEEVESNEPETLQNSNNSSGADYLLMREHMEEEQQQEREGTEVLRNAFVEENIGILSLTEKDRPLTEPAIHESGDLFEDTFGQLVGSSMKIGIENLDEEFDAHFGSENETDPQEELLIEFEIDESLCEFEAAGGETTEAVAAAEDVAVLSDCTMIHQKITETSFFQKSVDGSCKTYTILQDVTESGFLKKSAETEAKSLEDGVAEIQDAGIDIEEDTCGVVEETEEAEDKTQTESFKLQGVEVAAKLTTEKENAFNTGSELTQDTKTEAVSDEALDISNNEMLTNTEAAQESIKTESKTKDTEDTLKDVTESEGGCTSDSISARQHVIEEEILDLWIQTALSEDTDEIKQEEPGPGQEMGTEVDTSNERGDETLCVQPEEEEEEDKEQEVEVNSQESQPFSDPNASSSTAESGFLDQSLDDSGTHNNKTQLLEPSQSFPDIYSMLADASESAGTSELSIKEPECQDLLNEETADADLKEKQLITEAGFYPDSVARHLSQGSDKLPEKTDEQRVESAEDETGLQPQIDAEVSESNQAKKTDWKDAEEADVKSLKKMGASFEVEPRKAEDEALEMTGSDSPDETKDTDSGRSCETETTDIVPTQSGTQHDPSSFHSEDMLLKLPSLDKAQPEWSEEIDESEPGFQNHEQPQSEDQVDARLLDFTAQRSRIAVKNRRVRPPKDPRSLLHKPSVEPSPTTHLPAKIPVGVPLGGLGIGIKLPGLGAGFPVLKKTPKREENNPEPTSQEPETKPEDEDEAPKKDNSQHKPKWMPPGHPGFGNPLMSELKTKLKKTPKE